MAGKHTCMANPFKIIINTRTSLWVSVIVLLIFVPMKCDFYHNPYVQLFVDLQEDLVKYPEKHGEIIASIKERRDACIKELSAVEKDIMS